MNELLDIILNKYEIFFLVFARITGIFLIAPLFSAQNIPKVLKIGLSFVITIILTPILDIQKVDLSQSNYIICLIKEVITGIVLGYICYGFFSSFYVLGQIVDMEIGFGMVNVIDPQNKIQVPIMGNFYYIFAFLLFLIIDGHHMLIKGLIDSYKYIPIGKTVINDGNIENLINILGKTFSIGFKMSCPVVAAMLLSDILLGILSRTMPQMNVFVVGMPFKIIIGLLIIGVTVPLFIKFSKGIFNDMFKELYDFYKGLSKG